MFDDVLLEDVRRMEWNWPAKVYTRAKFINDLMDYILVHCTIFTDTTNTESLSNYLLATQTKGVENFVNNVNDTI